MAWQKNYTVWQNPTIICHVLITYNKSLTIIIISLSDSITHVEADPTDAGAELG